MTPFFALLPLLLPLGPSAIPHDDLQVQLEHATAAIDALPGIAELYLERAELYRLDRNFEAARLDLETAQDLGLNAFRWGLVDAELSRDVGNAKAALKAVRKLLKKRAASLVESCHAWKLRAELAQELGLPGEALAAWNALLQNSLRPDPDWYLERALLQDDDSALSGLRQGIERLGHVPALLLKASALEERLGHPHLACDFLRLLAKESPRKETWLSKQGDILWRAGLTKAAIPEYRAALVALRRLPHRLRRTPAMLDLAQTLGRKLVDAERERNES